MKKQINTDYFWQSPQHWVIAAGLDIVQGSAMSTIQALLSEEEQARMQRFRRPCDQQRYALAHGLKRFCLSKILKVEPASLLFKEGDKGKPFCDCQGAPQFNISHSGDWVLLGVSSISDIGVDVEVVSRDVGESVARYALSVEQFESVKNDANPAERFMLYWTQKEAISKALGVGLSIDFKTVNCSGQRQVSQMTHSGRVLTVNSRFVSDSVISTAATVEQVPGLYQLSDWQGDELVFHTFVEKGQVT